MTINANYESGRLKALREDWEDGLEVMFEHRIPERNCLCVVLRDPELRRLSAKNVYTVVRYFTTGYGPDCPWTASVDGSRLRSDIVFKWLKDPSAGLVDQLLRDLGN